MAVIFNLLNVLLAVYELLFILRALTSWIRLDPYSNPIARFLYIATEPVLEPLRNLLPPTGGIDFSPMIAIVGIIALQQLLSILATNF